MRIVHISDFHISENNLEDIKNNTVTPLIIDLLLFNSRKRIDFIIFTGDMVDKGGASFDDIELGFHTFLEKIIEPLTRALNLPYERFILTPGNHDMLFSADKPRHESGLLNELNSEQSISEYMKEVIENDGDVDGIKRNIPFKNFEKDFYSSQNREIDFQYDFSPFNSNFKFKLVDKNIGISSINTSWRSYTDNDEKKLLIGELQLTRSRSILKDSDYKIAVLHHSLDFLKEFEKKQIEAMLYKDYDLILSGHVHEASSWANMNLHGTTIISVAASIWSENTRISNINYMNGYSIIDVDSPTDVSIHHRRYSHRKESFVSNTDLGTDSESGISKITIPNSKALSEYEKTENIIEKIKEMHIEHIDQHLISYETDTIAPKKINELFVLPKIVHQQEKKNEISEIKSTEFSIDDLLKSSENLILFGTKEAGKTVLMDKILLELVENHKAYRKIPIYIDFKDVKAAKFDTIISRFLGCPIREVKEEILAEQSLVLLIDNLSFYEQYKSLLIELELFMKKYIDIKVIATSTSQTDSEIPIESMSTDIIQLFKPLFIKNYKTKEIRELMEKWFTHSNGHIEKKDQLDNLIKTLSKLNISRTPLTISMFLWIIEKQESYSPVNNAQMLENFLERLLSKTSFNEVRYAEFNYKNKLNLLTEIAYFMYQKNDINYRVKVNDLRAFVSSKFEINKFDFDSEEILSIFIKKGILMKEFSNHQFFIKFKFSCFFQFYLMKNIDKKQEFKDYIFSESEDNYLKFIDELDYYSGVKIDDVQLLEFVTKRMEKSYKKVVDHYEKSVQYAFDNPFETKNTMYKKMGNDIVEELKAPTEEIAISQINNDEKNDLQLSDNYDTDIEKKDGNLDPLVRLERSWTLAAKVLKNTEDITISESVNVDLKKETLMKIVRSSVAFAAIYKLILKSFILTKSEKESSEIPEEQFEVISTFLPILHEILVYQTLGTGKLSIVLEEIIEENINSNDLSDLEKFVYVFVYSDLDGRKRFEYIHKLINNSKRNYTKDMIFFKLLEYYNKLNILKKEEVDLKNLLGDVLNLMQGPSNKGRTYDEKSRIIRKLEKDKRNSKDNTDDSM